MTFPNPFASAREEYGTLKAASATSAFRKAYLENAGVMGSSGAVAGGIIGSFYGHPLAGAVIGAGTGLAVKASSRSARFLSYAGKNPVLKHLPVKTTAILAASALIFGGITMARGSNIESSDVASDGYHQYQPSTSSRMQQMNAQGDLVFGLNKLRHG